MFDSAKGILLAVGNAEILMVPENRMLNFLFHKMQSHRASNQRSNRESNVNDRPHSAGSFLGLFIAVQRALIIRTLLRVSRINAVQHHTESAKPSVNVK